MLYNDKFISQISDISSCLPIYINEIPQIHHTLDSASVNTFAEIEPNQKEHIIVALRQSGKNVVGYMGDGINDASALHVADAGISVDTVQML